jgi:hypothetical protein
MPAVAARSVAEIVTEASRAECGHCWCRSGQPCSGNEGGIHVARLARAERRGLITGAEFLAVIGELDAFTAATVVSCEALAGAA